MSAHEAPAVDQQSELVARTLARISDADDALAALLSPPSGGESDAELLHDYRVALRRLRSILRPLGFAFGKRRTRVLADALREHANTTGELRDEEVLRETLEGLELGGATSEALGGWMVGRARRERGLRARVLRVIRESASTPSGIKAVLAAVRSLLSRPPKHAITDHVLAKQALTRALRSVRERTEAAKPSDADSMHRLRIGYKRLRYTLELIAGTVGGDVERDEKLATKMQKHLGKLHDLDEALVRIERARGLSVGARGEVLAALSALRAKVERRTWDEAKRTASKLDDA